MKTNLLEKLAQNSTVKTSSVLSESEFFVGKDETPTDMPILNCAASGTLSGGFRSGLTVIAGPSKHFKSYLGLIMVSAYLRKNEDAVCLYYDSEFGAPPEYLASVGIDTNRVLHTPVMHLEQLKFDMTKQLENISRGDKVIIFIDSVGNLASKKEVEDALDEKSVADMTRAKQMKSVFRIATPHFTAKDIPCIAINHTYKSQGMFPTDVVSGGTGIFYSSDAVWIIGRSQEKTGTDVTGYKFTINIEKSRYVREKSKFPFIVKFDSGIDKWSGLMDFALALGYVTKPKNGWYTRQSLPNGDKNWRLADTSCSEFWKPLINETNFASDLADHIRLGKSNITGQSWEEFFEEGSSAVSEDYNPREEEIAEEEKV